MGQGAYQDRPGCLRAYGAGYHVGGGPCLSGLEGLGGAWGWKMNNTNLDRVIAPSGLTGLMPPKHLGRRIGMPNTVVRSFQAPRPIASPSHGSLPPLSPGARGALSTLKFAWGGLAGAPNEMPVPGGGREMPGSYGAPMAPPTGNFQPPMVGAPVQPPSGQSWLPRPGAPGMTSQLGGNGNGGSLPTGGWMGGQPGYSGGPAQPPPRQLSGGDVAPGGGFANPRLPPPQQPGPFKPMPAPFGQPGTNPPMMRGPLGMGRGMNFRQPGMRMAMGGPVDFEQVLGSSGGVPQAMQAYGSPLRLAEGGAGWWGPFQRARLAGAAGPVVGEQRHGMGPEDLISQAPNYAGTARALGTPADTEDESMGLADFAPYGRGWRGTAKTLHDFGRGALRGAKHWPAEVGEFLSLPASIPLNALVEHYTGMTPEDIKAVQRQSLGRDRSDFSYPNQAALQRRWEMDPRERQLEDYPSMSASPSRAENIGQETAAWLNPGFLAGPLAAAGNWLARPAVKG